MKINWNCMLDVLLYLEKNLRYIEDPYETTLSFEHNLITVSKITKDLRRDKRYELADLYYSIEKLLECNYIVCGKNAAGDTDTSLHLPIADITIAGHEFLAKARSDG